MGREKWSESRKKKFAILLRKKWADPKYRRLQVRSRKEAWKSEERRKLISSKMKKVWKDPNYLANQSRKQSEAKRKSWQDPEYRRRLTTGTWTRSKREEAGEKSRKWWARQPKKEPKPTKRKKTWEDPQWARRQVRKMSESWEGNEERKRQTSSTQRLLWSDPTYRAKMLRARKKTWKDPEFRRKIRGIREVEKQERFPRILKGIKKLNPKLVVLTKRYGGREASIKVKCQECETTWVTSWAQLKGTSCRCYQCTPRHISVSEEKVRCMIEEVTGMKFPKVKPSEVPWLHGLHLDGYNRRHQLAFEYQGPHHYQTTHWTKFDRKALKKQKRNDARKKKQCQRYGVKLVVIPYWFSAEAVKRTLEKRLT